MFFPFTALLCLHSKLMHRFSQLLNSTAGISETGNFLKINLNLESQGLGLNLYLQYPESHEIFFVFSL